MSIRDTVPDHIILHYRSSFHSRRLVAEVPDSLTGVLGAAQQHGVGALGRTERQLVESDALSASRQDAGASGFGKPEGAHCIHNNK